MNGGGSSQEDIEEGQLKCIDCSHTYPVIRGIPRMFPEAGDYFDVLLDSPSSPISSDEEGDKLADAVKLTVTQYSAYQGEVFAPMADKLDNARILEARTGLKPEEFSGLVSLDAGCGAGRLTRVISDHGADLIVGFDAGYSIDEAKRISQSSSVKNIEWVQGDILRAPFKKEVFDRVISIGVLHHTAAPDQGFRKLASLVNQTGSISVYLYTHAYLSWDQTRKIKPALGRLRFALLVEPFRRLVVKLPNGLRMGFCKLLWLRRRLIEGVRKIYLLGEPMAKLLELLTPPDVYKPLEDAQSNISRNFDMYSTPYNYSHDFTEVIDWFERLKRFKRLEVTPFRLSITGFSGEARQADEPMNIAYRARRGIEKIEAEGVSAS